MSAARRADRAAGGGKFILGARAPWQRLDWGDLVWHAGPRSGGARRLVMAEVKIAPGRGHDFHKHPRQEEIIFVLSGAVEQWLGREKRTMGPGDGVFIPRGTVHATFNSSRKTARLLAVLGPPVGKEGYQLIDVSAKAPWRSLR